METYKVVEGVSGQWFYHLTDKESPATALCGARTMSTSVPLHDWGFAGHPGHIQYRYCKECERISGILATVTTEEPHGR